MTQTWKNIIYPAPLEKGDLIGITAPSSGISEKFQQRLNLVLNQLEKRGFRYQEGACLRKDYKRVSADAKSRAKDFINLWNNPEIKSIMPPWGGELVINIFPLLDFSSLRDKTAKWVLGYSDTSTFSS